MSDKLTVTEALELARKLGPEWDALLARMEGRNEHWWKPQTAYREGDALDQRPVLACQKCGRVIGARDRRHREANDCPKAVAGNEYPVTEPLPCIVDREIRGIAEKNWRKFIDTILQYDVAYRAWFLLTPAEKLVYLWLAEGRLEK